jgi:hypothetical protein
MSIELHIGEIVIDGPSLTRREREELRIQLQDELASRIDGVARVAGVNPTRPGLPTPAQHLTEVLADGIAESLFVALPTTTVRQQGPAR